MANPLRGEARLRDYTLAFNFGVFCALEERTGKKVPELAHSILGGVLGFGELRDFVFCGLQTHHSGTTEDDVLKLLDETNFQEACDAVGKAVASFFAPQKEGPKNPPNPAQ